MSGHSDPYDRHPFLNTTLGACETAACAAPQPAIEPAVRHGMLTVGFFCLGVLYILMMCGIALAEATGIHLVKGGSTGQ